jgi:hypothetical protein
MSILHISPLSLDQTTRDYWGSWDAAAIAQLAELADDDCFQLKFYKAPSIAEELMLANAYVAYGLKITPGSLIFGIYNPAIFSTGNPPQFDVQITDQQLEHQFWSEPVPSYLIGNFKPTYGSQGPVNFGSFPNLLNCPHPVTGDGLFLVELWNNSGSTQRVELVLGVLENVEKVT